MISKTNSPAVLLLFLATSVFAQQREGDRPPVSPEGDRPRVSPEGQRNPANQLEQLFRNHDLNRDGVLSGQEFMKMRVKLTSECAQQYWVNFFKEFDADRNGVWSGQEIIRAARSQMREQAGDRPAPREAEGVAKPGPRDGDGAPRARPKDQ